jgi:hypothetical protein
MMIRYRVLRFARLTSTNRGMQFKGGKRQSIDFLAETTSTNAPSQDKSSPLVQYVLPEADTYRRAPSSPPAKRNKGEAKPTSPSKGGQARNPQDGKICCRDIVRKVCRPKKCQMAVLQDPGLCICRASYSGQGRDAHRWKLEQKEYIDCDAVYLAITRNVLRFRPLIPPGYIVRHRESPTSICQSCTG